VVPLEAVGPLGGTAGGRSPCLRAGGGTGTWDLPAPRVMVPPMQLAHGAAVNMLAPLVFTAGCPDKSRYLCACNKLRSLSVQLLLFCLCRKVWHSQAFKYFIQKINLEFFMSELNKILNCFRVLELCCLKKVSLRETSLSFAWAKLSLDFLPHCQN